MTQNQQKTSKLTDLNPKDQDFREELRSAVKQRLAGIEHRQLIAFALRNSMRTAWLIPAWQIKDKSQIDRYMSSNIQHWCWIAFMLGFLPKVNICDSFMIFS